MILRVTETRDFSLAAKSYRAGRARGVARDDKMGSAASPGSLVSRGKEARLGMTNEGMTEKKCGRGSV